MVLTLLNAPVRWPLGAAAVSLLLVLLPRPGLTQIDSGYIRSFPNGAQISIDTEDGVRCSANGGTRPYATVFGGYDGLPENGLIINNNNNNSLSTLGTGAIGGVSVTIPLGDAQLGKCDRLRILQEAKSSLALANQLFEAGLMSEAELKSLSDQIKPLLIGRSPKPADEETAPAAQPSKPVAKPTVVSPPAVKPAEPDEAETP